MAEHNENPKCCGFYDKCPWLFIVKAVLALAVAAAFIWGYIVERVSTEIFVPVVTLVFAYIFSEKRGSK